MNIPMVGVPAHIDPEFKAERATEAMRRLLPVYARVRRNGEERRVSAQELVPGDVIWLSEGDRVSADSRLVETSGLHRRRGNWSIIGGKRDPDLICQ
jgi:P-type Ca2+ transporter type 2C